MGLSNQKLIRKVKNGGVFVSILQLRTLGLTKIKTMTNTLRVAVSSLFLLGIFFTAALTWEGCTNKKPAQTLDEKAEEAVEKFATDTDDFFEEDFDSDYDTGSGDNSYSDTDDTTVDYAEIEDKATTVEAPTPAPRASNDNVSSYTSSNAKYMVVAGNFLVKENAATMVSKLMDMGYNTAEWAVFDYSQYHTVIVARTNDYNGAQTISSDLKSNGIDNYVHTRK